MSQTKALTNQQIARAAMITLFGFLTSGVLGFVRLLIVAQQFGTGEAMDAFITAQRIPEFVFVLIAGGALGSSFIPIYARQRDQDPDAAWRLASAVMTLSALSAAILCAVIAIFADPLVSQILLHEGSPEIQALTADLMRLMMVTPVIFAVSGLVMGILQSHGLFVLPSLAISMNNIGIILGALLIAPSMPSGSPVAQAGPNNVYGLAYGAILSAVLHLVVQLPGLYRLRAPLRVLPNLRIPGVIDVLKLMGPRVLGLAVVQINFVVNIILAGRMAQASIVALGTAFTLMFTALGIIAQSVGSAVFPTLAALYAENNLVGFKDRLANAMRSVLFLGFPCMIAFIVLAGPIVSIFERGRWTPESTAATAWALALYAIGIPGFALLEVLSRAFYAAGDTWTPVLVGVGAMVSNIVLSLILVNFIGDPSTLVNGAFGGLALANALTTIVEALVLWGLMRRKIGSLNDRYILRGSGMALLAAVIMGVVLFFLHWLMPAGGISLVLLGAVIGGAVFFGIGMALGLDEAKTIPGILLRRARR